MGTFSAPWTAQGAAESAAQLKLFFSTTDSSPGQQPQQQLLLSGGRAGSVNWGLSNVFTALNPQLDTVNQTPVGQNYITR